MERLESDLEKKNGIMKYVQHIPRISRKKYDEN